MPKLWLRKILARGSVFFLIDAALPKNVKYKNYDPVWSRCENCQGFTYFSRSGCGLGEGSNGLWDTWRTEGEEGNFGQPQSNSWWDEVRMKKWKTGPGLLVCLRSASGPSTSTPPPSENRPAGPAGTGCWSALRNTSWNFRLLFISIGSPK